MNIECNHQGMEIKAIVDIAGALLSPIICAILFGDWRDDKDKPMWLAFTVVSLGYYMVFKALLIINQVKL